MQLQQLKYFSVLCEKGSFGKAADSLRISQQGLSMAISRLEDELSCQLFRRTSKGVSLTSDGEFLKQRASHILNELDEIQNYFEKRDNVKNVIRVAGCEGVLSEFAAALINEFENSNPSYSVHIREFKDVLVEGKVSADNAELGLGLEPINENQFECHRVFQQPMALLMRRDDPLASYERIPVEMLKSRPVIMVDEMFKSSTNFIDECRRMNVIIEPKFRVGEIAAVHRLVRQGEGVGLTVASVSDSLGMPDMVYRYFIGDNFNWNVDIFKKRSSVLSKGARLFFEYVKSSTAFKVKPL